MACLPFCRFVTDCQVLENFARQYNIPLMLDIQAKGGPVDPVDEEFLVVARGCCDGPGAPGRRAGWLRAR